MDWIALALNDRRRDNIELGLESVSLDDLRGGNGRVLLLPAISVCTHHAKVVVPDVVQVARVVHAVVGFHHHRKALSGVGHFDSITSGTRTHYKLIGTFFADFSHTKRRRLILLRGKGSRGGGGGGGKLPN